MWKPDEFVTHAIFEFPPKLQAWALEANPSHLNIFPVSSIYTNMDYLFWRKSSIEDPEMDSDPYRWIIWYLWKLWNDKLFIGIKETHWS